MKFALLTVAGLTAVNAINPLTVIPKCALTCFEDAIKKTSCSTLDFFCQCSNPAATIVAKNAFPCLCNKSTCSEAEIQQVAKGSEEICSSAFKASSKTYTATPIPSNLCKALTATTGKAVFATASSSSSASAASSSSSSPNFAPIATAAPALMGMGAMAMLAL